MARAGGAGSTVGPWSAELQRYALRGVSYTPIAAPQMDLSGDQMRVPHLNNRLLVLNIGGFP